MCLILPARVYHMTGLDWTGRLTNSCIQKRDMSTVVSHGAVFRALNKEDGPQRQIMASLGVLQHEIYNPNLRAHLLSSNRRYGMDGKSYVLEVIEWIIRKVRRLLSILPRSLD